MLTNLKLRNRILLGYSIPLVLFIGLAIPVFSSVTKVSDAFKQTKVSINAVEGGTQMAVGIAKMARDVRGFVAVNKEKRFLSDYQTDFQYFQERANFVEKTLTNPEQQERLMRMVALGNEYDDFAKELIAFANQGKQAEAVALLASRKGVNIIREFDEINTNFNQKEHQLLDAAIERAESNLNFLIIAVEVGTVVGIAGAILAAFLISSGIAQRIQQAIVAIATSSTEIATTLEQQERTASQQASSVNETTTTMDELGASSRQSAEQAEAAAVAAQQALGLTEGGNQAVEQTLEGMSDLKDKVEAITQEIIRLSHQTNQIGDISGLVTDLANQTNMLALNAAVEAVRAGEYGKGFGVVAAEIRKLADESKRSAEKIKDLVSDIQNAINATVMVTNEGTRTVSDNMQIAQRTADTFVGVADAVNNVVMSNRQISLNIKQQAIAVQQVVTAMNSLNQGAQETASGITQIKVGTQKLNQAAQDLKAVV